MSRLPAILGMLILQASIGMLLSVPAAADEAERLLAKARMILQSALQQPTRPAGGDTVKADPGIPFVAIARDAADRHALPLPLILAVIDAESAFNPQARSPKGALGLMQVMPATASGMGIDPAGLLDPCVNIDVGSRYLREMINRYEGRLRDALAAYNFGPTRLDAGHPLPDETGAYIERVRDRYAHYSQRLRPPHLASTPSDGCTTAEHHNVRRGNETWPAPADGAAIPKRVEKPTTTSSIAANRTPLAARAASEAPGDGRWSMMT